METLFKKYFWVLNSVLLVLAGFALSRTLSSYVEHELLFVPFVQDVAEADEAVEEGDLSFRRPLAVRSVDLERREELAQAAAAAEKEDAAPAKVEETVAPPDPVAEEEPVGGNIDLELIATVTVSDPTKNMALVRIDGGDTHWVGHGTQLKPGFQVTRITNYYIAVSQGVTEVLWRKESAGDKAMLAGRGGPTPPRKMPERATSPQPPRPEPKKPGNEYAEGIKQTGPFDYRIDRGMLNEQLQDLAKLGREARVIPNYDKESGTYKGFKLIGVRPNSLYRAIGIRSGDVISQINGEELSSPGKALELFTQLQNSSSITLDIQRRGKAQTFNYTIE